MDTTKLRDAIGDLREKRDAIDDALHSLENALAVLSGSAPVSVAQPAPASSRPARKSNMDWAIELLEVHGPIHIEELAEKVSDAVGHEVSRATLDGAISREIREKNGASRFERVAPGIYGLRVPALPESQGAIG